MRTWLICNKKVFTRLLDNGVNKIYDKGYLSRRPISAIDNIFVKYGEDCNLIYPIRGFLTFVGNQGLNVETYCKVYEYDIKEYATSENILVEIDVPAHDVLCIRDVDKDYGYSHWVNIDGIWYSSGIASGHEYVMFPRKGHEEEDCADYKFKVSNKLDGADIIIPYIDRSWIVACYQWKKHQIDGDEINELECFICYNNRYPMWTDSIYKGATGKLYTWKNGKYHLIRGSFPEHTLRLQIGLKDAYDQLTVSEVLMAGNEELLEKVTKLIREYGLPITLYSSTPMIRLINWHLGDKW